MAKSITRRSVLQGSAAAGLLALTDPRLESAENKTVTIAELDRILAAPVIKTDLVKDPVTVTSIELLKNGNAYLLRTRSTDGVEAITVPNPARMAETYPIFLKHILPVFI